MNRVVKEDVVVECQRQEKIHEVRCSSRCTLSNFIPPLLHSLGFVESNVRVSVVHCPLFRGRLSGREYNTDAKIRNGEYVRMYVRMYVRSTYVRMLLKNIVSRGYVES